MRSGSAFQPIAAIGPFSLLGPLGSLIAVIAMALLVAALAQLQPQSQPQPLPQPPLAAALAPVSVDWIQGP
jgi:hypothetical protein